MKFYMITYGFHSIEEIYVGKTRLKAIANARELINCWPQYAGLSDEEILEELKENDFSLEFELVNIPEAMPEPGTPLIDLIAIYNKYWSGQ